MLNSFSSRLPKFIEWLYYKICIEGKSNSENVGTVDQEESVLLEIVNTCALCFFLPCFGQNIAVYFLFSIEYLETAVKHVN